MKRPAPTSEAPAQATPVSAEETRSYVEALEEILLPLARLMIGKGLTYPMFDDVLQRAYVQAALQHHVAEGERVTASRLYMLTGIHRKKIQPLLAEHEESPEQRSRPLSLQVLDLLTSEPQWMDRRGRIKPLPVSRREGGEHSFDALVESVSRDIRPRAVLDQWLQAGIATLDEQGRLVVDLDTHKSSWAPGEAAASLLRMLHPVVQLLTHNALALPTPGGAVSLNIEGASVETAKALADELQEELRSVLLRFNQRAERRVREERRRGRGGPCVLQAGGFHWIDAPPAEAAAPPAQP